ncbi:hypothetical protein [Caenibius tardaugens]|nr:hypothetical protein [Caenibius tardaugens]AZI35743.1 hypothetical protein EGO55_06945 [Caenibius tardaugens NBRC 16725]
MTKFLGVTVSLLAISTAPAMAESSAKTALFAVDDVNRDTVPAGTPEAFQAAFGKSSSNAVTRAVDDQNYSFVPLALIPLSGGKTALISTGASECTGHVCGGLNTVHYLQPASGQAASASRYAVAGEWMDVGASGTFGNPALRWGWTDAIASAPVLYTEGGGVWQGYACSYAVLTELTPAGPVEIASIPIYYSDGGAKETGASAYEGTITSSVKNQSFTVTYTGSKTIAERYIRNKDGKYELKGKTKVPQC